MRRHLILGKMLLLVGVVLLLGCSAESKDDKTKASVEESKQTKRSMKFTGGPSGGTYEVFGDVATTYLSDNVAGIKFFNQASDGSIENIRKVAEEKVDFGISFSGDTYLARHGRLPNDSRKYDNVRAISFVFKSLVHLAVLKDSKYRNVKDLEGKKVGIGGQGSGAAASATRYFKSVGIWDNFEPQYLGYNNAAAATQDGKLDGMWILVGPPASAIMQLSARKPVRLLNVWEYGQSKGFTKEHPYYNPIKLKASDYSEHYRGMDKDVSTFFDSAIWITHKDVPEDIVYKVLKTLYTDRAHAYMLKAKKTFKEMVVSNGVLGISFPLHKGAERFWNEKGVTIPDAIKSE